MTVDVVEGMKQRDVLVSSDGPYDNVLKIKPPLVLTAEEADVAVDVLDEVLATMVR